MIYIFSILIIFIQPQLVAGEFMQTKRPDIDLYPASSDLERALKLINQQNYEEAALFLKGIFPNSEIEKEWTNYLSGLVAFGKKDFDLGVSLLDTSYKKLKAEPQNFDADFHRLVAKCLKKLGWNFRRLKEYEKAYTTHSIAFQIYDRFGSYSELHDASISLDVDSYFLGDFELEEYWLRKSIEAGKHIQDGKRKAEALGISYNNLASVLYNMKKFLLAEESIKMSFEYWAAYEGYAGSSENKLLWANYGIGDVYHQWFNFLQNNKDMENLCNEKKLLAINFYKKALELAQLASLKQEDIAVIQSSLDNLSKEKCKE